MCDGFVENIIRGNGVLERIIKLLIPCAIGVITYAIGGIVLKVDYVLNIFTGLAGKLKK